MHANFGGGSHNQWKKKTLGISTVTLLTVGLEITHVASCKGARLTSERPQVYI